MCWRVLKKVVGDKDEMKRSQRVHRKGKIQTRDQRKTSIHFITVFQLLSTLFTGRYEMIFLSRWRNCYIVAHHQWVERDFTSSKTDADYADDIAILANTPDQAETLQHSLERAAANIGLYVNAHKTEYMCYNQTW